MTDEELKAYREKQKQEKAKAVRRNKKLTDEEIAESIKPWSMSMKRATQAIHNVRWQIKKSDEWYNMYRWNIEEVDSRCESWASIYTQSYGYSYEYDFVINTGFNKYETTLHDCEGWYTE